MEDETGAADSHVAKGDAVDLSDAIPTLRERQIVKGIVVRVDSEGVLVDVGAKSEGIIPLKEMTRRGDAPEPLAVGDQIDVMVMRVEGEEGNIILSKKRADFVSAWDRVVEAQQSGAILHAMVVDKVKGGLVVDLGIRGFVPGSHVDLSLAKGRRFEAFVGQAIPLRVIEVDRGKGRVILSHKQASEEERKARRESVITSLQEGEIVDGTVKRITDFGAFVDLGGVDGLLPISEMAWTYIRHPSEVVRRNQQLKVQVLRVDHETGKISLGLKQILEDPWTSVGEQYHSGDVVKGKVVRTVASGAFIRLRDLDAFLPISEIAEKRVTKVEDAVQVGQPIEVMVTDIRPDERRMIVSLKRIAREAERKRVKDYMRTQEDEGRVTIGDAVGALLRQAVGAPAEPAPSEGKTEPEPSEA
jgi:small subunit ribosomal protein S1/4-hydroxy-3-methylbut-2-en-1-yl diphosphate reductase